MSECFDLVAEAIAFARTSQPSNGKSIGESGNPVSGRFLCWKFHEFVVDRYGDKSLAELRRIGIKSTSQIGAIAREFEHSKDADHSAVYCSESLAEYYDVFDFATVFELGSGAEIEKCERQCLDRIWQLLETGGSCMPELFELLNKIFQFATRHENSGPVWRIVGRLLCSGESMENGAPSQRMSHQIARVTFEQILPRYLKFHEGKILPQPDDVMFNPFFVGKTLQITSDNSRMLADVEMIAQRVIAELNQTIGRRPVPVVNGQKREPDPQEWIATVPLYIRGTGIAVGRYREIVQIAVSIFHEIDGDIAENMLFDPDFLFELAFDPRSNCFEHPNGKMPSNCWGYWDENSLGENGYYERLIVRRSSIEFVAEYIESSPAEKWNERTYEAGVALAGLLLMASGMTGNQIDTQLSRESISMAMLRTSHSRDAYYQRFSDTESQSERSPDLLAQSRPFGDIRDYINIRTSMAEKLQNVYREVADAALAVCNPDQALKYSLKSGSAEAYWLARVKSAISRATKKLDSHDFVAALEFTNQAIEDLHQGIRCGAIVDPWFIAGFKGEYQILRESFHDSRCDRIIITVRSIVDLLSDFRCRLAFGDQSAFTSQVDGLLGSIAKWWDEFGTDEVEGFESFKASEIVRSTCEVAKLTGLLRASDEPQISGHLSTCDSYIRAMTQLGHDREAIARELIMDWLRHAGTDIPRCTTCLRHTRKWLDQSDWTGSKSTNENKHQNRQFLLGLLDEISLESQLYVWPEEQDSFTESLTGYLEFQKVVSHLFTIGVSTFKHALLHDSNSAMARERILATLKRWLKFANSFLSQVESILIRLEQMSIGVNVDDVDSRIAFDQKRQSNDYLINQVIEGAAEIRGVLLIVEPQVVLLDKTSSPVDSTEQAILFAISTGDRDRVKQLFEKLYVELQSKQILYIPLDRGGHSLSILEVLYRKQLIQSLLYCLPKMGLLPETLRLTALIQKMEKRNPVGTGAVTEFDVMFQIGFDEILENVISSADSWSDDELFTTLEKLTETVLTSWLKHGRTLRLSCLEKLRDDDKWTAMVAFIKRYGNDFISQDFLHLQNIRAISRLGVGNWLAALEENPRGDWEHLLLEEIDDEFSREAIIFNVTLILDAVLENWSDYSDYKHFNSVDTADFGCSIYIFLDLLRLKAAYDRIVWNLRPIYDAHFAMLRLGRESLAERWQTSLSERVGKEADKFELKFKELMSLYRVRVGALEDRISGRFVENLDTNLLRSLVLSSSTADPNAAEPVDNRRLEELVEQKLQSPLAGGKSKPDWLVATSDEIQKCQDVEFQPLKYACESLVRYEKLTYDEIQHQTNLISQLNSSDTEENNT